MEPHSQHFTCNFRLVFQSHWNEVEVIFVILTMDIFWLCTLIYLGTQHFSFIRCFMINDRNA